MHIKTLQEFLLASDASLAKHLTETVIAALKDHARRLESRQSAGISAEIDLSASFPRHIVAVLRRMGVKRIDDFSRFSKTICGLRPNCVAVTFRLSLHFAAVTGWS
jgi:hypothetical protein